MPKSLVLFLVLLCPAMCAGQADKPKAKTKTNPKDEIKRISLEDLATSAPLPVGYAVTRQDVKDGDKVLAHKLQVIKEGAVSKAVVTIEARKISTREEKVAATKGYINGTAQAFREAGLKLVDKKIPDLDKADFGKRVTADVVYEKPDGGKLYLQIQSFFEDTGCNVVILSDDEQSHEMLTKWALSVEKKKPSAAGQSGF